MRLTIAWASDMRSPCTYCAMGIPDTSTTRWPSRVMSRQRSLMTCMPFGFRASGKRSSLGELAIPGDTTPMAEKSGQVWVLPPVALQITKNAQKSRNSEDTMPGVVDFRGPSGACGAAISDEDAPPSQRRSSGGMIATMCGLNAPLPKKRTGLGPPPLPPPITKNATKLQEIADTMSGVVESVG